MWDATVELLRSIDIDGIWRPLAIFGSIAYALVLAAVIRRGVALQRSGEEPTPDPKFYLAQAYLAFMWPLPLFLAFEALDSVATWIS